MSDPRKSHKKREHASVLVAFAATILSIALASAVLGTCYTRRGLARLSSGAHVFADETGGGILLSLFEAGGDAWGFLEWPDKNIYGFFRGERSGISGYSLEMASGNPAGINLDVHTQGRRREISVSFADKDSPASVIRLDSSRDDASWALRAFGDQRGQNGRNGFFLAALDSGAPLGRLLDARLRRGKNVSDYVGEYWDEYVAQLGGGGAPGSALVTGVKKFHEKQYLVGRGTEWISIATERYVFSGGAHGAQTLVCSTFDPRTGASLRLDDLLVDGWKAPIEALLRMEALRVISDRNEARQNLPMTDLKEAGFFEDRVPVSSTFFLCASGIGFHYDRYELAPYSEGDFTFVIPWYKLEGMLNEKGARASARLIGR